MSGLPAPPSDSIILTIQTHSLSELEISRADVLGGMVFLALFVPQGALVLPSQLLNVPIWNMCLLSHRCHMGPLCRSGAKIRCRSPADVELENSTKCIKLVSRIVTRREPRTHSSQPGGPMPAERSHGLIHLLVGKDWRCECTCEGGVHYTGH